jgi:hypothetical protein
MPERSGSRSLVIRVAKQDTMNSVIADSPTRAPAIRDRDHADHDREPEPSRIRVLLEALAYAGAFIDPTGCWPPDASPADELVAQEYLEHAVAPFGQAEPGKVNGPKHRGRPPSGCWRSSPTCT